MVNARSSIRSLSAHGRHARLCARALAQAVHVPQRQCITLTRSRTRCCVALAPKSQHTRPHQRASSSPSSKGSSSRAGSAASAASPPPIAAPACHCAALSLTLALLLPLTRRQPTAATAAATCCDCARRAVHSTYPTSLRTMHVLGSSLRGKAHARQWVCARWGILNLRPAANRVTAVFVWFVR